jgi:hypothetical protein
MIQETVPKFQILEQFFNNEVIPFFSICQAVFSFFEDDPQSMMGYQTKP